MNNQSLLIVDDDAIFAHRLCVAVTERGFQVRTAATKQEALAAIEDELGPRIELACRSGHNAGAMLA